MIYKEKLNKVGGVIPPCLLLSLNALELIPIPFINIKLTLKKQVIPLTFTAFNSHYLCRLKLAQSIYIG